MMFTKVTLKQKRYQAIIVSELLVKPLRFQELWNIVQSEIKSKEHLVKNLSALTRCGVVERIEKNRKHVTYRISQKHELAETSIVSFAKRIGPLGSVEVISDAMNFLIHSDIFENKEEAIQAAIDFWVEKYRNLCVLNALFSLDGKKDNMQNDPLEIRRLYQRTEDRFFAVIRRLSDRYPEHFRSILEKKLLLKGMELKPSWVSMNLSKFLEAYYPKAHQKLGTSGQSQIYFNLMAKEKEKEYIACAKYGQEFLSGVCTICETFDSGLCKYRKVPSVREKILKKRENTSAN